MSRVPTFTFCKDKKFYENLIYQDDPRRKEWFICFDDDEPAEIVVKASSLMKPQDILTHRGLPWKRLLRARRCDRFFGNMEEPSNEAVSWFIEFLRGAPFPTPNKYDACDEVWPIYPNREGVYYGWKG